VFVRTTVHHGPYFSFLPGSLGKFFKLLRVHILLKIPFQPIGDNLVGHKSHDQLRIIQKSKIARKKITRILEI
jgi:hypothetical protein